jgi:hypothetical protein
VFLLFFQTWEDDEGRILAKAICRPNLNPGFLNTKKKVTSQRQVPPTIGNNSVMRLGESNATGIRDET